MPLTFDQIEELARALPAEDRARLVESLLETLVPGSSEVAAVWEKEIEARAAAFDHGELESFPAEDVFAEARRISG